MRTSFFHVRRSREKREQDREREREGGARTTKKRAREREIIRNGENVIQTRKVEELEATEKFHKRVIFCGLENREEGEKDGIV